MGSQHSHEKAGSEGAGSGGATPRGGSRRGTGAGETEPDAAAAAAAAAPSPLVPVEKLGKILSQRSQKEDGINGVTETVFVKYLFGKYPELGARLFGALWAGAGKARHRHLSPHCFRQQAERLLALLDDEVIVETYVRMFNANGNGGSGVGAGVGVCAEEGSATRGGLRALLHVSYRLSMDHYPDGPQACFMVEKTLDAIVSGCFGQRERVSCGGATRWLREHCPRLVLPVHRYVVHVITTSHRSLAASPPSESTGLGLGTPVLEAAPWARGLLTTSAAWLVAAAAPPSYSVPHALPHPGGISSSAWVARLVCLVPVHWAPLYASPDHGLGANRFLHHVTAYRGPSILLLAAGALLLVVACPEEWRESQHYWGGRDAAVMQLYPQFSVLERGPKLLYLNTHIRGYPRGLRVGSDPKEPLLQVDEDFDKLIFRGDHYPLSAIEVWGCGDSSSRETQLEIKKWQVKEAERQRNVKLSAADWIEHPDRYLLELAGRPQYNNSAS